MDFFKTLAVGAVLVFSAASVQAATLTCDDGSVDLRKINGDALDPGDYIAYDECFGPVAGNDVGDKGTLLENLESNWGDLGDWAILGKSDSSDAISADPDPEGMWSVVFDEAVSIFAVSIKSSNEYSAYLFDLSPDSLLSGMGFFAVYDDQALSHMTIAYVPGTVDPIPLPAAGWLLLGGLGGLAAMKRRRKS